MQSTTHSFDLVVVGATPGGIACALRGARCGLRVLLTQYNHHIGGMWSNGLGAVDTQYAGRRAPIYAEVCDRILEFYRNRYGRDSEQYRCVITKSHSRYSDSGPQSAEDTHGARPAKDELPDSYYGKFNFEPHVAEKILNEMVAEEQNLTLWLNCVPVDCGQDGGLLRSVQLRFSDGREDAVVEGCVFTDCTYEGDLLALAGAPYRIGRESREEFGEPHAGRIFTALHFATPDEVGYPREAVEGRLNLEPYEAISQQIHAGSTGEGDLKVQAYTFRLCLSGDAKNRVMPCKPPGYDREIYLRMRNRWSLGSALPNGKLKWNTSNLPGGNWEYPDADWPKRREILARHRDHALGFLWFLQNDEAVPPSLRERAQNYGLAMDEFTDNGNLPWEMYVREARRLKGRYIFKEQDGTIGRGLNRAPIHRDSIAITEWGMDSHSVSMEITPGSRREGKVLLTELTRPGQIPWRCLLPPHHENLLVPVCLSATHIGWGTIRLEPTWMHIAESAAMAAVLAVRQNIAPAKVKVSQLQRHLVENGVMISFFNEFDMATQAPWVPAVQFFGAKWFFACYDARPLDPLDTTTARIWSDIVRDLRAGRHQHLEQSRWSEIYPAPNSLPAITADDFLNLLRSSLGKTDLPDGLIDRLAADIGPPGNQWRRADACLLFYRLLAT